MSAQRCFKRKNSDRSHTIIATIMVATLCQAKPIIRFRILKTWICVVSHARMRLIVGMSRQRKSTDRVMRIEAPTPITPHLYPTVANIAIRKTNIETTEAGRFADNSSVAMLAIAEMELTIEGQMLSTTSTEANL